MERLKAKRKTIQEGLVETNIKPQRKAQLPSKEVTVAPEKVAAGDFAVASGADKLSHQQLMHRQVHVRDGETSGGMQCPFQWPLAHQSG